ncbi:hypothetical protein OSB04_020039 [Centaurea solstitialis]|uniref:Reverse transcriptase zinc-binding domain-containing protein n=1 Tax=Centaurea solstitialis TaxID=347529 RepID=A0AA38T2X3_9ASTR|nr:hypothetical protein OSB04_020039 [Centaurea solstitialis]
MVAAAMMVYGGDDGCSGGDGEYVQHHFEYNSIHLKELFALESDKTCSIGSRFLHSNSDGAAWTWSWVNTTEAERLADKVEDLEILLKDVVLRNGVDKWCWEGDSDGEYTVSSLRGIIDGVLNPPNDNMCFWNNWLPLRIKCFMWRLLLNRIPTRTNLSKRGVNTPSLLCPLCNLEEETVDHLFCSCSAVKDLWKWMCDWCMIKVEQPASLNQMLLKILEFGKKKSERVFHLYFCQYLIH